jgi:rubrerythrin
MVTMVGKQHAFGEAMIALLELEYDALEAYETALERISTPYKNELTAFTSEHRRHISELTRLLTEHQQPNIPTGPSGGKHLLTKGKVVLGSLVGDKAILMAMHSNEEDTNTAYERMVSRTDKWPDAEIMINQALNDEKKHKAWLEQIIDNMSS